MSQKTPSEFLKGVLGRLVVVKLNSGVTYRGTRYTKHHLTARYFGLP